jgi:PAS domain-containing protein
LHFGEILRRFFLRLLRLSTARVVGVSIVLWLGVAVLLARLDVPRAWLLAYGGATMLYAFVIAGWAMVRTYARLRGLLDEGDAPDGGLLLEALPTAAVVLDRRGVVTALNNHWLMFFELPRNQVRRTSFENFCDPVLRRHVTRALRAGEAVADLALSARTPDGNNVFFRADIAPLGDGWLLSARPMPPEERARAGSFATDRLRLLGRVAAETVPRLLAAAPAEAAELRALLAALANLAAGLDAPAAKPAALAPAALLAEAARLAEPAFAAKGVALGLPPAETLPNVVGRRPQLVFALTAAFLFALEETAAGAGAAVRAQPSGEDVELEIAYPAPESPREAFDLDADLNLVAARQIAREHDGELRRARPADGVARLILQLPAVVAKK